MAPPDGDKKSDKTEPPKEEAPKSASVADEASLEGEDSPSGSSGSTSTSKDTQSAGKAPGDGVSPLKKIIKRFDIYLLVFLLLILIALVIAYVTVQKNKNAKPPTTSTQVLDQNALKQINSNDTQVGGTNQTLDVQSDTVFGGNVLVKDSLDVAGSLKVAGSLTLPGITVSGTTDLDQVNANSLTLTGAETVKGQLTVNDGMTVNGVASFSGILNASAITTTSLQINGDLQLTHHITTSGGIPKDVATSSIGAGGTTSLNGSDDAGQVSVNTGSGASQGCLVNITFVNSYVTTPHVVITPVGSASGGNFGVYITISRTGFSICAINPPDDAPMSFDYVVLS